VAKDGLTDKQQLFALEYAASLNGTEAAARAGYSGDRNTLGVVAFENLRKPKVRAEIDRLLKERTLQANEVLSRLADQARGIPADCFNVHGKLIGVDFEKLKEYGLLHLVKKVSYDRDGRPVVEFYDAQAALVHLGKHHGLFAERLEDDRPPVTITLVEVVRTPDDRHE
jgi:hypothetical protein